MGCHKTFIRGNDTGFMLLNETVILVGIFLSALFIRDESQIANAIVSSLYIGLVLICCSYSFVYMVYSLIFDTVAFFENRKKINSLHKAAFKDLNDEKHLNDLHQVASAQPEEPPSFNDSKIYQNDSNVVIQHNPRASQYESQEITIDMTVDRHTMP